MTALVDTNVVIGHLTGDPPDFAARATAYLRDEPELVLTDLVVAETVDPALLLRAVEVYETGRIDFVEAYLVACAESTGIRRVASFDRSIDRIATVKRIEPPLV